MALTLSNSGIESGSIIRAAEISQSIDAFTGVEAYNINLSGSLAVTGSTLITGSLSISGSESSTTFLKIGNNDNAFSFEVDEANNDSFTLKNNDTGNKIIRISTGSSNNTIVTRNDLGTDSFERVGINWPYENLDILTTTHHLNISGSATASAGFYGTLTGTASLASKVKLYDAIANQTLYVPITAWSLVSGDEASLLATNKLVYDNVAYLLMTTASWATASVSASHADNAVTASYALTGGTGGDSVWYDGTTYISASVLVSGSDSGFKGGAFVGGDFSGSTYIGTKFSGSYFSASNGTTTTILNAESLQFNENGASHISNINTGTGASLRFSVGGTGASNYTALHIDSNHQFAFGNPSVVITRPLGFTAGQLGAYAQFENDNAVSASVVAIKGATNSDGVLYIGGTYTNGGGILWRGDSTSDLPASLGTNRTSLYRSESEVAYPVISYPYTDNQIVFHTSGSNKAYNDLDYVSLQPTSGNLTQYYRNYHLSSSISTNNSTHTLGEIPMLGSGVYLVKYYLSLRETTSPPTVVGYSEINYIVRSDGGGTTPTIEQTTPIDQFATPGLSNLPVATPITNGLQLRSTGTLGASIQHTGWAIVTYSG